MAYDKKQLEKKAINVIKKHKIMFIQHLSAHLGISRSTFYDLKLDKSDTIKKEIESMRISRKTKMLSKWIDSDVPTLQIAAMKMISDDNEAHRLNGTRQEIKHDASLKSTLIKWKPAQEE